MKKLLLILMLAVVSSSAMAEWVAIGISEDKYITYYADLATLQKKGDRVKMWSLIDYKIVIREAGLQYMSTKQQQEYECKEVQVQTLHISAFSKNMGKGEVVFTGATEAKWEPISPDSHQKLMWKSACGK